MKTMLANNNVAFKMHSLLTLLFFVGLINAAKAATYYSNGTVSITNNVVSGTIYTASNFTGATVNPTLATTDILNISAGTVTFFGGSPYNTLASFVLTGGTITINAVTTVSRLIISGNLVMSGGTININGNLQIAGNLTGPSNGLAQGTITGTAGIVFNGGSYGSGGSVNTTTGAFTPGTSPNPQLLYADFSASSYSGTIQSNTYLKLAGSTSLPSKFKNAGTTSVVDLNGYSLTCTQYYLNVTATPSNVLTGGGNSALILTGTSSVSTLCMDQKTTGTSTSTNALNITMNAISGILTLYNSLFLNSNSTLTKGIIYLNGQTVTTASLPSGNNDSYFSSSASTGGSLLATSVGTSPTSFPIGFNPSITSASGSSTTITCASTTGLIAGATVFVSGGTGAFASATTISSITDATRFVVSTAPTTTLAGATISIGRIYTPVTFTSTANTPDITVSVAALTSGNLSGGTSNSIPYQWTIKSSITNATSTIAFQTPNINSGFTTTGSNTAQLGVLLNGTSGYANVVTTSTASPAYLTSLNITGSGPYVATTPSSYSLYNNLLSNTYVIANTGSVFPLPTITSATSGNTSSGQPYSYTITGANVGTLNATNLPTGLSFTTPTIAGSPTVPGLTNIALTNTNIAGIATATLALNVTSAPIISSATIGVAQAGSLFSYTITANNSPTSFAASLISNGVASALTGSSTPYSISGATISGTRSSFGKDSIQLVASNADGSCPTTYLVLNTLDVPTVTSISPSTSKVDTITSGVVTITVNGTNFANGYSTVTWAGNNLSTVYNSPTQLTASVPFSYFSRSLGSSTATVGVTSAGTNVAATPSTVSLTSTVNKTFTLTVSTPTVTAIYPSSNIAGAGSFTITVNGTNFASGVSTITWNGTPLTTTFIDASNLKATVSGSSIASAGTANVGVTNSGVGITNSATTRTFTTYAQGVTWSFATNGTAYTTSGVNLTPTALVGAPTHTNIVGYNYDSINNSRNPGVLAICPSTSSTSITWNADGGPSSAPVTPTLNNTFSGVMINNVNTPRYVQFDVAPQSGYNFTVSNIAIPVSNTTNTGSTAYAVAYSLNNFSTFTYITANTTSGVQVAIQGNSIASFSTPIIVPNGSTLSIRLIVFNNRNSGTVITGTFNINNVMIAGTTSVAYPSPTLTSSSADVNGIQNSVFDGGYTYAATQEVGYPNVYSATGLPTGLAVNATTGAVTGTPTVQGTYSVVFKADNSNLFPLFTTINFVIDGQAGDPTTTSISPTSKNVDATQFTLSVKGTNYVSGKSTVKWIASTGDTTALATTYLTDTTLSAIVPANLVAATAASASPKVIVYNTGAVNPISNTRTFTLVNLTPAISAVLPAGSTTSASPFTMTVYGSNFTTNSKITWAGAVRTTTFVSSTQLTATINANGTDIASTGNTAVGVSNTLAASTSSSATTQTYVVGNASATWVNGTSNTPTIVGNLNSTITTTPTTLNVPVTYSGGQVRCGSSAGSISYPADGLTSTVNNTFTGISASFATNTVTTATRYIDFKISPITQYNLSLASISIPVSLSGGSGAMRYSAAYSIDGGSFTQFSTDANTANINSSTSNTYDISILNTGTTITNFVPVSPITVNNGSTLTVRIIAWRKSDVNNTNTTVNIGPLTMVGNVTVVPTPTAPIADSVQNDNAKAYVYFTAPTLLSGVNAVTSYKVYAYANGSATASTSATALVSSLALPYNILVSGLTNGTSYAFKVSAINSFGEGSLSNLSESVIPSANTTWNGTEWSAGEPDAGQNAIIAANLTTPTSYTCNNFTVNSGVTFINNGTFTVKGSSFINNGTITGSGITVLNAASAQTITGIGTVCNLTINNTSGVSVTSGSNMLNITGVLTLQRGALTTNSNVTFKSTSIANTGTLAAIDGATNTGSISGTVTVERYIPAGYRGYRDLAPQVNNAGSIYNSWQEGGAFTSGKGIFITGPSATDANVANYATQPAPNSEGLDYSINGLASAFTYNNSNASWYSLYASGKIDSIYNTKTINLTPFTGYRVLVRGDRSFNLATTPIVNYYNIGLRMVNPTVLRATGNLVTGTVTYNTSGVTNSSVGLAYSSATYGLNGTTNKFSMIANPYAAPVMWGTGTLTNSNITTVYGASSNINASYWFLNPTYGGSGTYAAYNALSGSVYAGSSTSAYIQPGQAFFVQTSASSPTVVFKETAKETGVAKVAVFGKANSLSKIYISLLMQDANKTYNNVDAAAIAFNEGFTNTYGPQDAVKFGNSTNNLSIVEKGKKLSIDGRLPATANDKIPVSLSNVSGTAYQLDIDATSYIANGFTPFLIDSYRGVTASLTNGLNSFKFTVDAKDVASFENRFSIAFKPTTLAVNSIIASVSLNSKVATITWNTIGEKGVSRFEVEKSIDAKNFVKIGQVAALNIMTATYTATDNNTTTAATNYYRIKVISGVGTVSYSNVAKLTNNSLLSTFTLYPNPLKKSQVLNVTMDNVTAGKYTFAITSILGQKVHEQSFSHQGGNASHPIAISKALAAGNYIVTIKETSTGKMVHQLGLDVQP